MLQTNDPCMWNGSTLLCDWGSNPTAVLWFPNDSLPFGTASSGNQQFAQDIVEWAFQSSLVTAIAEAKHYIASDPAKTQLNKYTINTQVRFGSLLQVSRKNSEHSPLHPTMSIFTFRSGH